jgi:hypothetical protein
MKDIFVKLLSELKDGGLISESKSGDYTKALDKYLEDQKKILSKTVSARSNVMLEAQDKQHAAKLEKLVESIDADHCAKLEKLMEAVDVDHTKKLKKVVESIDTDHCAKLEKLVEAIDVDHSKKLKKVMEAVDIDHTKKLEKLVESIDVDHSNKLQKVISMYEQKLKQTGKTETVSEAKAQRLVKMFKTLKDTLMVNEDYMQTEIREAVLDAHAQIQAKSKGLETAIAENAKLSNELKDMQCKILLEKKLSGASPRLRTFVETYCANVKTQKDVEAKFDEAVTAFNKEDSRRKTVLAEKTVSIKPTKPTVRIEESVDTKAQPIASTMDRYVQSLENIRY